MKKTLLIIPLILTLFISNIFAQYITNYNLGNGYNYFKSITKSQFIRDAMSSMHEAPRYMGSIESEQDINISSFLNLLRKKNGDLAKKYNDELFKLDKEYHDAIVFILSDNEKVYRFALIWTKQLEIISDYYKDTQNVYTEMEIDQNTINESYTKTTDSIINLQKLKFVKSKESYSTQLNIVYQDSNKFKNQLNVIYTPIKEKYKNSIDLLKKEKKDKIDQLPQTNFVQNRDAINIKYDNLISAKVSQANLELKNAYNKYLSDNEQQISEYSKKIKELRSNIDNLDNKLNNVNDNLDSSLPPKPVVNETKFQEKLNQIGETREQKLAPLRILLANLINSSIQSNKIVPIIR